MNVDDIRAMRAGRELDALVAELLFGWQRDNGDSPPPSYSTDRTTCGAVIDWASDMGIYVTIFHCLDLDVECVCWSFDKPTDDVHIFDQNESAAVCKAVVLCAMQNGFIRKEGYSG